MISQLRGVAELQNRSPITVLTGGVGYEVFIPVRFLNNITNDQPVTAYIHTHVRDDAIELYGFASNRELELFTMLISVSGVGPKTALLVLDRTPEEIYDAIRQSDVDFFTTIPRLGKKNAQKIIIELKNKIGSTRELDLSGATTGETRELIDALTGMGFAKNEVVEAIGKLDVKEKTMEQKIRTVLKYLGKSVKTNE